jgi:hypothetical protein
MEIAETSFLRDITAYRMINSKGNKDNKEELGIADIDVIIRIGLK